MKDNAITEKIGKLKLIATDFDGIWTNGMVYIGDQGQEMVRCSRKDTLRIKEIQSLGIEIMVISKEESLVVSKRCQKMNVVCFQGVNDKITLLKKLLEDKNLRPDDVAYVGDDINDLECLKHVGLPMTVADGHKLCKEIALYTTTRNGGDHAMREIFDLILSVRL